MPDEQTVVQEATQKKEAATEQPQDLSSKFQGIFFGEPPITNGQQKEELKKEETKPPEDEYEVKDPSEWFKEEFKDYGFEDVTKAKETLSEWKKKAETPAQEIKLANAESEKVFNLFKEGKVDDVIDFYNTQKTLSKLISGEVNESNAADIIKFSIKNKYGNEYTNADVDRRFNKMFGIPKEPVYNELKEAEDEFKEKHNEWEEKVKEIKSDILLEAKTIRPELLKLKAELVLPELPKNENAEKPLSQEDLANMAAYKESFLRSASSTLKDFDGFSVTVKDKDVELPVNYGLSSEEKSFIDGELKKFAENNYDVNPLFADRWVNEDRSINTKKMAEDLSRLYYGDKVFQKFATDAANKRLEAYLKEKKNINLDNSKPSGQFEPDNKTVSEKMAEKFFA